MLKYVEVANKIRDAIQAQHLAQGAKLPSLSSLVKEYQVSKTTMVKSLATLEQQGAIFQVQGSGIFVRLQSREGYIPLVTNSGFSHDLNDGKISSKTLSLKVVKANDGLKTRFQCDPNEDFYAVKRLRFINDEILCIENSFFRKSIIPYLNQEIVNSSIFEYISQALNLKIGFSDKYLRADELNEQDAGLLKLPAGAPGFYLDELFYSNSGVAFDLSQNVYHYKNAKFFMQSINK